MCWLAVRASETWEWIDKRQIFERFVALAILYGTIEIVAWSMTYAETHVEKSGVEAAAIIAAVATPYMALQAAAIAFMFRARMG
jgi:hypothetical protein